jgi:hypothetical protein
VHIVQKLDKSKCHCLLQHTELTYSNFLSDEPARRNTNTVARCYNLKLSLHTQSHRIRKTGGGEWGSRYLATRRDGERNVDMQTDLTKAFTPCHYSQHRCLLHREPQVLRTQQITRSNSTKISGQSNILKQRLQPYRLENFVFRLWSTGDATYKQQEGPSPPTQRPNFSN